MARTPKTNAQTKAQASGRPARVPAPISFTNEDDHEEDHNDSTPEESNGQDDDDDDDDGMDLSKLMKEIQKRQAKKTSMMSAAFENQKKALYASARKEAKEMSREGIAYLENLKATLLEARKDEVPFERYLNEVTWKAREDSLASFSEYHTSAVNDLFPRRAQAIEDIEERIRDNPSRRDQNLRQFLESARREVDLRNQSQSDATDASRLIKHLKAILRG